jgi:hypothetical protein
MNRKKQTKVCSKCKLEKDISDFYTNSNTSDKLTSWCIQCYENRYLENEKVNNSLTLDDLKFLIDKYNNLIKNESDYSLKNKYRKRLTHLKTYYKRKFKEEEIEYTENKKSNANIKLLTKHLLSYLGYYRHSDIRKECEIITDILYEKLDWEHTQFDGRVSTYSNITLAFVIVSEVLNRYNESLSEEDILHQYSIPYEHFIRLSIFCHK